MLPFPQLQSGGDESLPMGFQFQLADIYLFCFKQSASEKNISVLTLMSL